MKLPNGFGQISHISGRLRNPWRARITVGTSDTGRPICKPLKPVSYFKTYNEAYTALIKYHENPYETKKDITFKELYEEWYKMKEDSEEVENLRLYTNGYNYLTEIYNMRMSEIKPKVIRNIIDKNRQYKSIPKRIKTVLNLVFDYAVENEIVDKNYARITKINTSVKDSETEHHISFTPEEISILWQHSDERIVKIILIQCYTGFRPGELMNIKPDQVHEDYIIGGSKTDAGKNRKIPIHYLIKDFIKDLYEECLNNSWEYLFNGSTSHKCRTEWYRHEYKRAITEYQLNPDHKCHDPRKYFITEAKLAGVDEYAIKLIVGHAISDLTERIYTDRPFEWLLSEISKIPKCRNDVGTY